MNHTQTQNKLLCSSQLFLPGDNLTSNSGHQKSKIVISLYFHRRVKTTEPSIQNSKYIVFSHNSD